MTELKSENIPLEVVNAINNRELILAGHLLLKLTNLKPNFFNRAIDHINEQNIINEFTLLYDPNYVLIVPPPIKPEKQKKTAISA